jgi:hypothetical protein
MDLEETEARNDCTCESQQQFNRLTNCNGAKWKQLADMGEAHKHNFC